MVHISTNLVDNQLDRIRRNSPAGDPRDAIRASTDTSLFDRYDRIVPPERLRFNVRGPVAAHGPSVEELHDLWPFPRGKELGPRDRVLDALPLGRRHAACDDEGFPVRRQLGHAADHLPLRRFDDGARDEDMGVGIVFGRDDAVALADQRLLHEARLSVILRATMRLDEDLHGAADGYAGIFGL